MTTFFGSAIDAALSAPIDRARDVDGATPRPSRTPDVGRRAARRSGRIVEDRPPGRQGGASARRGRGEAGRDAPGHRVGGGHDLAVRDRRDADPERDEGRPDEALGDQPLADGPDVSAVGEEEVAGGVAGGSRGRSGARRRSRPWGRSARRRGPRTPGRPGRRGPRGGPGRGSRRCRTAGRRPPRRAARGRPGRPRSGRGPPAAPGFPARSPGRPGATPEDPSRAATICRRLATARGPATSRACRGRSASRASMKSLPPMKTKARSTIPSAAWDARPSCWPSRIASTVVEPLRAQL